MTVDKLLTVIIFNSLLLFIPVSAVLLVARPQLWQYLFAVFLGVLTGWFDLRTDEVSLTILLLVVFGLFLGFAQPRHAWRWALILAVWVPLGAFVAGTLRLNGVVQAEPNWLASLFAFVPALVGAYGGALVKWASNQTGKQAQAAE